MPVICYRDAVLSTSRGRYASYSPRLAIPASGPRLRDGPIGRSPGFQAGVSTCRVPTKHPTEGCMRLVLFEGPGSGRGIRPGVWTDNGVVDVSSVTNNAFDAITPQQVMEGI